MFKRTSNVKNINVTNVSFSSVFEIGDSCHITPRSKVFAVQREYELFYSDEGNLKTYPIFTMPLPKPMSDESVNFMKYNESFAINVNNIDIIAVSGSGVLHIGSTKTIDSESRTKHIRQLLDESGTNDEISKHFGMEE